MPAFLSDLWPFQPDVVEAYATVVAVIFAGIAAWYAKGAFDKERDIDRRLLEAQESEQASLVAAWMKVEFRNPLKLESNEVLIQNASKVPIYNVVASVWLDADEIEVHNVEEVVHPGDLLLQSSLTHARVSNMGREIPFGTTGVRACRIALTFDDAAGRGRTRTPNGILQRT